MAKQFDPRKVLKQVSNPQLREFFTRRNALDDVPWDELTETKIEPVFEAWQAFPETQRKEVQVILQDVNELADDRGLSVLAEEINWRCPDRMPEFAAWEGRVDRAMWVYLNAPEAFDEAALFARADALAAGRYWIKRNDLPRDTIIVTPKLKADLAAALRGFYWPRQMRGFCCSIEHYTRASGAEYFFAYLEDYPDRKLVFDDAGEVVPRSERYAFENVFVLTPSEGALELHARGGKKVWAPLQEAFCLAVLAVDVGAADPLKPAYQLDHLLDSNFPLRTDPNDGIADARIIRMRLEPKAAPMSHIEVKADRKGHPTEIYQMMEYYLNQRNAPASAFRLHQASFRVTLLGDGRGKLKTLTFNVSCPNTCDLKSQPDDLRSIGERCLKLWEIVRE